MAGDEEPTTFHEEIMMRGEEIIDPKDWCYDAQKRVANGSDGLWLRFGAKPGPSCAGQLFSFRFNPCVSFFATVLLFGLVGFCSTRPGFFCTETDTSYEWTTHGGSMMSAFELGANDQQAPGVPALPSMGATAYNFTNGMTFQEVEAMIAGTTASMNCSDVSGAGPSSMYPCRCGAETCGYMETCTAASDTCSYASSELQDFVTGLKAMWSATMSMTEDTALLLEGNQVVYTADGVALPVDTSSGVLLQMETFTIGSVNLMDVPALYNLTTVSRVKDKECFMPQLEFDDWMAWVTQCFTWLYIITQDIWIVFGIYLAFSKYGKMKLGREHEVPEFNYFNWFALLFTCGIASGLFYFAVSEPQYYYLASYSFNGPGTDALPNTGYYERNRWTYTGVTIVDGEEVPVYNTINDRVQNAMTTTWYHWGLHGWVVYSVIGVLLALLHFRKGLPMTIKTCFYPIMGSRIYGFSGDLLDTVSVVATTMGVCTSLGIGVMQVNNGIEYLNGDQHWLGEPYYNKYNYDNWKENVDDLKSVWDAWPQSLKDSKPWYSNGALNVGTAAEVASIVKQNDQQLLLIWIITATATFSVLLGLKNGIKQLAALCLALGQFIIFYVWMMDDTYFITNLFVQTLGHYIGQLPTLGFYASSVEQTEVNNAYGEYSTWQFWWTIFYWGWWIAWAPFVGVFLARISKGRTVREFIFATLFTACLYNFTFLNILGGAGLKMQLLAEKYEIGTGPNGCNTILATELATDGGNTLDYKIHPYKKNVCRPTSTRKYNGESEMFCSTITNIACSMNNDGATRPLWNVVGQYSDTGRGMVILTLIGLVLYFVASSDSGSMVDDMVTANGLPEACHMQRFYWAMTEGAAASALLSVGKFIGTVDGGLKALRAASICVGLPYTFLCCIMCVSLMRTLQYETGELTWNTGFKSSVLDIGVTLYQCGEGAEKCFNGMLGSIDPKRIAENVKALICPALPLLRITAAKNEKKGLGRNRIGSKVQVGVATAFYYIWFLLLFVDFASVATEPVMWGSVLGNASAADGNSQYYTSNRYGYFHQWSNDDDERDVGEAVTMNSEYEQKAGGVAVNADGMPCSVTGTDCSGGMYGVGNAMAKARRISAIGWFLFFMFIIYCTALRNEVRELYHFVGGLTEDFFCCLLWPMALVQMQEQMDEPILEVKDQEGDENRKEESI